MSRNAKPQVQAEDVERWLAARHGGVIVGLEPLVDAMRESVPAYRHQHLEANERALRAGAEHWPLAAPAWQEDAA